MNREDWLKERRKGIGSSDAPAVCGVSPFKTAAEVQLEKLTGKSTQEDNDILLFGRRMEPVILAMYKEKTGVMPRRVNRILQSKEFPWMIASLDARSEKTLRPIEAKMCVNPRASEWGEEYTDEIPRPYIIQAQHQLVVTEADYCEIPVIIFGKLRIYNVKRNEALIKELVEIEREFWQQYVVPGKDAPIAPIDYQHPRALDLIELLYPTVDESLPVVPLGNELQEKLREYKDLGKELYRIPKVRDAIKAEVLDAVGASGRGLFEDGATVVRQIRSNAGYTVDPYEYSVISYKEKK